MQQTPRAQSFPKAYTIIESLVVLVILALLTVVLIALLKHEKVPSQAKDTPPKSLSEPEDKGSP